MYVSEHCERTMSTGTTAKRSEAGFTMFGVTSHRASS